MVITSSDRFKVQKGLPEATVDILLDTGVYRSGVSKDGEPEGVVVKSYCVEEMFGFKLRL